MTEFIRRIQYLLNRQRMDRELANDMAFHREMAAMKGAGARFGKDLRLREEARDAWGWTWIERLSQDLRYAARQLRRSPGFAIAAILMLAIGIGANVAAFSFYNLMALRPLPVRSPNTLLRFKRKAPNRYATRVPYPEMEFFREHSRTLSAVLAVTDAKLDIDGESKPLVANFVTANYFNELDRSAALGRVLDPLSDGAPNAAPVVVLSNGFWKRHFGANRLLVGRTIRLNGKPVTVIGVAESGFSGLSMNNPDVWLPIRQQPYFVAGSKLLTDLSVESPGVTMFGRVQPGLSARAVEDELGALAKQMRQNFPDAIWAGETLPSSAGAYAKNVTGGRYGTGKEAQNEAFPVIVLVTALVLLILVVACGNLGGLLVAKGVSREREMNIRTSVGAAVGRLIRQLLTESLLLALLGAAAGLAVGSVVLRTLMTAVESPAWLSFVPDWRVLIFATGIAFLAAILFGLTPALQVARRRHRRATLKQVLIGAQIAGSCVLVIVAALLIRAVSHFASVSPGFEYRQVISIDPGLLAHGFAPAQARIFLDTLRERVSGIPGIQAVSMSSSPPLGNKTVVTGADIEGRSLDVHMYGVDPEFFATMRIPLLRGRGLIQGDRHALVISQSLAAQWPTGDALGRPFQIGDDRNLVVGVSGSARLVALEDADAVEAYYLAADADLPSMVMLLRTSRNPEDLIAPVRAIAKSIDPEISPEVQLMKRSFQRKMDGARYAAISVGVLGAVALMLACLGVIGLVAYSVSQRRKEIGIRVALGARPGHVLSVLMRNLTWPLLSGLVCGTALAAALSQLLRRQLYGISNLDPGVYIAAVGVFAALITVSALIPAIRAVRADPLRSLRYE